MNQCLQDKQMGKQEAKKFERLTKDRSANKTPLYMRKASRRAKNKVARKSRQLNQKV